MKIKIEVDIGPTELREFLGLPDTSEMQRELLQVAQKKFQAGVENIDPVALVKGWMPLSLLSVEQWQRRLAKALEKLDADIEAED